MGTEKISAKSSNRSKPPPVPPRPLHLIPIKSTSKYSSMPDILNEWRRDANPDLLKPVGLAKRSQFDVVRIDNNNVRESMNASDEHLASTYCNVNYCGPLYRGDVARLGGHNVEKKAFATPTAKTTSSALRKFSCIPSRSSSKKKKEQADQIMNNGNCRYGGKNDNHHNDNSSHICNNSNKEISQTSWYVEDVTGGGVTTSQLSKCEISVKFDDRNYRYVPEKISAATVGSGSTSSSASSTSGSKVLQRQQHCQRYQFSSPTMSSSLAGLPPLPRSLIDASLLLEMSNKKLSSCNVNLSPAPSNSSGNDIVHPKIPPPSIPRSHSISSNEQKYCCSQSTGDAVPREERPPPPPPPRKPTSLDLKLSLLRKEMHVLRQMDLSLLSQLWSLNEAIQEFRLKQELLSSNALSLNSSDEDDSECYTNVNSHNAVTPNQHNNMSCSSKNGVNTNRIMDRECVKS